MPELFFAQQLILLVVGIVLSGIIGIAVYHYGKKVDCETVKKVS